MADKELVIKIPEELYQMCRSCLGDADCIESVIANGIPLDKFLEKAYEEFCELEFGESYIIINGEKHWTDVGYAFDGIGLFMDFLEAPKKSYCDTCKRSTTCASRDDAFTWCSHYIKET